MEFGGWLTCPRAGLGILMPPRRAGSGPYGPYLEAKITVSLERFKMVRHEGWGGNARTITQDILFPAVPCWLLVSFTCV